MQSSVPDGEYPLDMSMLWLPSSLGALSLNLSPVGTACQTDPMKLEVSDSEVQLTINSGDGTNNIYRGPRKEQSSTTGNINKLVSVFDPTQNRFIIQRVQPVKLREVNDPGLETQVVHKRRRLKESKWIDGLLSKFLNASNPSSSVASSRPTSPAIRGRETEDISKTLHTLAPIKKRRSNTGSALSTPTLVSTSNSPTRTLSPIRLGTSPLVISRTNSELSEFETKSIEVEQTREKIPNGVSKIKDTPKIMKSISNTRQSSPMKEVLKNMTLHKEGAKTKVETKVQTKVQTKEEPKVEIDRVKKQEDSVNNLKGIEKQNITIKDKGRSNSTSKVNKPTGIKKSASLLQKARRVHSRNQAQIKNTSRLEVKQQHVSASPSEIKRAFANLEREHTQNIPNNKHRATTTGLGLKKAPQKDINRHPQRPSPISYTAATLTPPSGSPTENKNFNREEIKVNAGNSSLDEVSLNDFVGQLEEEFTPAPESSSLTNTSNVVIDTKNEKLMKPTALPSAAVPKRSSSITDDIEFDADDIDWGDVETVENAIETGIGNITIEDSKLNPEKKNPKMILNETKPTPSTPKVPPSKPKVAMKKLPPVKLTRDNDSFDVDQLVDDIINDDGSDVSEEE